MSTIETGNKQVLLEMAARSKELVGAETSVIAISENDGLQVHYAVAVGKHAERLSDRRAPSATSGLCGVVFQSNQTQLVCQAVGDTRARQDHVKELGIDSALAVPVKHEGRLLGAIMVLNRLDGQLFDQQSEEIIEAYAAEAAPMLADYLK